MTVYMSRCQKLESKANKFAAERLREIRGDVARATFGKRIDMGESMLFAYEKEVTKIPLGRLASIARALGVPFSFFMLPDDDAGFCDGSSTVQVEQLEESA